MSLLGVALKEWAVVVDALTQGDSILLLRKGGIRERGGQFQVNYDQVWLLPTYTHQAATALKSPYCEGQNSALKRDRISSAAAAEIVPLKSWAQITHVFPIYHLAAARAIAPYHLWSDACIQQRLAWKPNRPLMALLLRVYRLREPMPLPMQPGYSGCRSWITLEHPLSVNPSQPVLDDTTYHQRVTAITASLTQN